jgi:hypothetical protein
MSEPVSPFGCVGRASAMCLRMFSELNGLLSMLSFASRASENVDGGSCILE